MSKNVIYLDNNATTCVSPEVLGAMQPFFTEEYGNPSSIHRFGGHVKRYVDEAREKVAALIGASADEIYFTSCGSESDNMALKGFTEVHGDRTSIITSSVEHQAILQTVRYLKERGVSVIELPVDSEGMIYPSVFDSISITKDTLVSLMWANNETGVIFPIEEIAAKVKSSGGFFHTDAVQAVGKIAIDVKKMPIDILSLSGHKLHAPKGIGAIYIRKGTDLGIFMHGGHQERGLRAGTENVPYIVGLGKACELAMKHMEEENTRVKQMRDRLESALMSTCAGAKLNGKKDSRLPNTLNISFEFIEGEAILLLLDENRIAASSGSACTTGSLEPSHVLRAMGIPYTFAHSSTRFSMSRYTQESDIDEVIRVMPGIVDRLRKISPFVSKEESIKYIRQDIAKLKKEKNAIILAHTYQPGEVQDIADYVGDSYGLSVEASKAEADVIVFCGVRFMAETAAILNPSRKVILAEPHAGCPMADMITPEELRRLKSKYPDHLVMCYVNSTAEIKALSDVCCTSSNAVKIANKLPAGKGIIFVPDKHLGSFVQEQTGREMVFCDGFCPTHQQIKPEMLKAARNQYPDAMILIHPEAAHECRVLADQVMSTGQMCDYVKTSTQKKFIIATELGIIHTLKKDNPDKTFIPLTENLMCPNMKKGNITNVKLALEGSHGEVIKIDEAVAAKARLALQKMLDYSR